MDCDPTKNSRGQRMELHKDCLTVQTEEKTCCHCQRDKCFMPNIYTFPTWSRDHNEHAATSKQKYRKYRKDESVLEKEQKNYKIVPEAQNDCKKIDLDTQKLDPSSNLC